MKSKHNNFNKPVIFIILLQMVLLFSNVSAFTDPIQSQDEPSLSESADIVYILLALVILFAVTSGFLIYKVFYLKKTKTLVGDEALTEINYAYLNLKNAWTKVKVENQELKKRNDFLAGNIEDLESANCELLTQREKLVRNENRLIDLQKQKEELYSIAIHDIKNPAAAIKSYVELLEGYDLNAVEQQEIVKYLIDSTEQIISLAQSINKSIIGNESELDETEEKDEVSIHKIVKSIISQNIGYANKKQVKLINKTTHFTPNINAQKSRIEEVIFNLVNNAIKFSPPETLVFVKSYFTDKSVSLEVTDNGVGIPADDIKHAFTKGGILSAKPTGDEESSGLGLWIVKKIIEEHGGKVWLESKENFGSTFGFSLPINKKSAFD